MLYSVLFACCVFIVFSGGAVAANETTITVWDYVGPQAYQDAQDEIILTYMKSHPEVKIELTRTPFSEHLKKLSVALATGRGPDIYFVTEVITYAESEFAVPMPEKYYDLGWKTLYPNWQDEAVYDGKPYAVFGSGGPRVLFYNEQMLKEQGLDAPPRSWEELREYAKKLTVYDKNGNIDRCGLNLTQSVGPAYVTAFAPFLLSNGGQWINAESGEVLINNPEGVETLQFWMDLVQKDKVCSMTFGPDSIYLGKSAMRVDFSGNLPFIHEKATPEIAQHIRVVAVPPPTTDDPFVAQDAPWKIMVSTNSKQPDAAWDFAVYLSRAYSEQYAAEQGTPVLYQDISEKKMADYEAAGKTTQLQILQTASTSRRRPLYWRSFATRLGTWIEKALLGEVTAQEALDNAKEEVEQVIAEGGAM